MSRILESINKQILKPRYIRKNYWQRNLSNIKKYVEKCNKVCYNKFKSKIISFIELSKFKKDR